MLFVAQETEPLVSTYEPFIPMPGATTLLIALIIVAMILWAQRRDAKYPRDRDE